RAGARLERIEDERLFVYIRHRANTWAFRCGHFRNRRGWRTVGAVPVPAEDRAFYLARAAASATSRPTWPGQAFLRRAVRQAIAADLGRG
ncbi:MAG: hypothetical protein ACREFU_11205, partial [Acetobacteraceae bacterium]